MPSSDKMAAVREARAPENKQELQAFLGFINTYEQFLRNKASVTEPLHRLLNRKIPWR